MCSFRKKSFFPNVKFINSAGASIPHELSSILKPSDFVWPDTEAAIGVLRLMPKILKMNTISRSGLPFLKSRRIKSAMKDPIRTLQKYLDKIYNHLLNELECVFVRRFNILSSSVSSATKQFREPRVVPQVHGETPLNLKEISGIYIQTATSLY